MRRFHSLLTGRKPQRPGWRALLSLVFASIIIAGSGLTMTADAAGAPPAAPTGLKASVSGTSVSLSWTNGAGALGASVFRDTTTKLWAGGWPSPTPTSYIDTGVSSGTHTYSVADYNSSGFGRPSATISVNVSVPPPAPTVSLVNPLTGPAGTPVTISGTNFTGATAVSFGANPAANFTVNNATTITATAPPGSGTVDVRVTTSTGVSATSANDQFTYSAGSSPVVIPSPNAGGWQLNGSATLVSSGSPPNLQLTAATTNEAGSAFWPTALPGVGISAAFDASIGSGTGADGLTFTLADASSSSPTALGSAGGGEGFSGINGIAVSLDTYQNSVNPSNNFVGIATGPGPTAGTLHYVTTNSSIASLRTTVHHFVVTTFSTGLSVTMDGSQVLSYSTSLPPSVLVGFTGGTGGMTDIHAVQNVSITAGPPPPVPTVTALSPATGSSAGGTSVTISGTGLTGASEVNFGAMAASTFTVNSDSSITATSPPGSGTVDVTVVTGGGTSATNVNDEFTFMGSPPPSSVATYRGDLGRSGYYPSESGLTTTNAANLKVHWTAAGGIDTFAQPIVANNMVFWSDWNGTEHGANLNGQDLWTTNIGTTTPPASDNCSPTTSGPTSTPTLGTVGGVLTLFVGGGNGIMYALNAQTGSVVWQTRLGTSPDNFLWDSPALYNGIIYMGVASYGDCPLVQGKLVALNATTGAITATADMVANGCVGGGIWSSPTVDTSAGTIWVTTGTPNACNGNSYAPAVVELRASDLSVLGYWNVPVSSQSAGDPDFGGTPTLFTATINGQVRSLVGAVDKDGIFYAWDRTNPAAGPVWQSTISVASGDPSVASIVSAAWDGTNLYVGGGSVTINGTSCVGSIDALNPSTGAFVWRSCQSSRMYAGITAVPGVIVEGTLGGNVLFLNAGTGATLLSYTTAASEIQGECTVSSGIVYVPLANGSLLALGQ
jgi:hypothetical protein